MRMGGSRAEPATVERHAHRGFRVCPGCGVPNGVLNNDDFFYLLTKFAQGC